MLSMNPSRPFLEALSLKTALTQQELDSRIDPSTHTYRYHTPAREGGGVNYDLQGRLIVYDAVPSALKGRHKQYRLVRALVSVGALYMGLVGHPVVQMS